jgi:membrane protease YdiL (CAAX protease family)
MSKITHALFTAILTILLWGVALIGGTVIGRRLIGNSADENAAAKYSADIITYLIVLLVLFLLIKVLKMNNILRNLKIIRSGAGRWAFLALFLCIAGDLFLNAKYVSVIMEKGYLDYHTLKFSGPFALLLAMLVYAAVGLTEEVCCRGILLSVWQQYFQKHKNAKMKAALISSIIFGAVHFINLANGFSVSNIIYTFSQIFFAAMYGMFFAALMFKTKSLWFCALLHGIIDLAANITYLFVPMEIMNSVPDNVLIGYSSLESIVSLLAIIPGCIWAVRTIYAADRTVMEKDYEAYLTGKEKSRA